MAKTPHVVDISGREHLENWLPVAGMEGFYEVSNLGRVRSVDRVVIGARGAPHRLSGRMLKQRLSTRGYVIVMMSKDGAYQNRLVHRLVLGAFVGEAQDGQECCHLNGVRTDNRLENLRWDTHSGNSQDQVAHGTHRNIRKTHCDRGHEFTPENTYIRPGGQRLCRSCKRDYQNERYRTRHIRKT